MTRLVGRALERELLVWARTWRGQVFSSFLQPLLFLGAMGLGLGGLVDDGAGQAEGLRYLAFVAPGLLVASAMLAASNDALWGVMAGVKWMGQFHSMVATALTPADVFGGLVLSAAVRAGASAIAFLAVAALLGGITSWWAPLAVIMAVLMAAVTFSVLAAYSSTRDSDNTFTVIIRIGVFPLFLFSGTFFPTEQLPDALQPVVWLSPLWHAAEVARMATTSTPDLSAVVHIAVLAAILAVAVPIGAHNFARRLAP